MHIATGSVNIYTKTCINIQKHTKTSIYIQKHIPQHTCTYIYIHTYIHNDTHIDYTNKDTNANHTKQRDTHLHVHFHIVPQATQNHQETQPQLDWKCDVSVLCMLFVSVCCVSAPDQHIVRKHTIAHKMYNPLFCDGHPNTQKSNCSFFLNYFHDDRIRIRICSISHTTAEIVRINERPHGVVPGRQYILPSSSH